MDWTRLFSLQILLQMLIVAAPVLLAAQGEILIQRSGLLNVSIEGMMGLGAAVGFLVAYKAGSNAVGLLAAMGAVALAGLVLAYAAIGLHAPQLTLGLALFIFLNGLASLLYRIVVGLQFSAPRIETFAKAGLPLPVLVVLAAALLSHLFFTRTKWGLWVRAAGENPRAADLQGINVYAVRTGRQFSVRPSSGRRGR